MIKHSNRIFANRVLVIPIKRPDVESLLVDGGCVPDTSDSTGGLDKFWEKIESF